MIGQAKLIGGLYHLTFPSTQVYVATGMNPSVQVHVAVSMNKLWHSKLCHLSLLRLKQIASRHPSIVLDNHDCSVCDACQLGK